MTPNRISLLLEIISFFCVTIDLYGKERLEKLGDRLHLFFSRLRYLKLSKPFWGNVRNLLSEDNYRFRFSFKYPYIIDETKKLQVTFWFQLLLFFIFLPVLIWLLPTGWKLTSQSSWLTNNIFIRLLLQPIVAFLIALYMSALLVNLVLFVIGICLTVVDFGVNAFIRFSIFLLVRMKLEGALLVIGTLIFLISKFIAFTVG